MWNTLFIEPLYNALMWLVAHVPGESVVLAIIILTVVVKLILAPFAQRALVSQLMQKIMQPEIARIKKTFSDKKQQAEETMKLYRRFKTNPFSGCLVIIIQFPIILALYYVFLKGFSVQPDLLYSFVDAPEHLQTFAFGVDMANKSLIIAILAGIAQFVQLWFSPTRTLLADTNNGSKKKKDLSEGAQITEQFGANMQRTMLFTAPILIVVVGMAVPAAVAMYWIVSSLFTLIQERLMIPRLAQIRATYYSGE